MIEVSRHQSAESFLGAARDLLLASEAENNLIIGIVEGLARNPAAVADPYLATLADSGRVVAAAIYFAPYKLVFTRGEREAMAALAQDAFAAVRDIDGITGPDSSAADFASEWQRLSGTAPRLGMRLRIHQARTVDEGACAPTAGDLRPAVERDLSTLTSWTKSFINEVEISDDVDAELIVANAAKRGRLYVWDDDGIASMAAWAGRTPNGVRIHFVYTPPNRRGRGYATACVSALTRQQLAAGSTFCWLYTDLSKSTASNLFARIGYAPVSDIAEYDLRR